MGITEAELFKQMEAGKVIAKDVLPLLAKEYKKAAASNGAFEAASKKTRAELNRFMTQLSLIKNTIYEGGFGKGLAYMFKGMANFLEASKGVASVLGNVLKGALVGLTVPFEIVGIFLKEISDYFNIAENDTLNFTAKIVGLAAAMWTLYKVGMLVKNLFQGAKWLASAIGTVAGATAGATIGTTVAAGTGTYMAASSAADSFGLNNILYSMNSMIENVVRYGSFSRPQAVDVKVKVNDGEVKNLIQAEVEQSNSDNINSLLSAGTK